jgi:hypothetical protein
MAYLTIINQHIDHIIKCNLTWLCPSYNAMKWSMEKKGYEKILCMKLQHEMNGNKRTLKWNSTKTKNNVIPCISSIYLCPKTN